MFSELVNMFLTMEFNLIAVNSLETICQIVSNLINHTCKQSHIFSITHYLYVYTMYILQDKKEVDVNAIFICGSDQFSKTDFNLTW